MDFTYEQKFLLALLSYEISGTKLPEFDIDLLNYDSLIKEASKQTVFLLFDDAYCSFFMIPDSYKAKWANIKNQNIVVNARVTQSQLYLNQLFNQAGLKYVTLKGFSASRYYLKPALRTHGDVDFLVNNDDFSSAESLLSSKGFTESGFNHLKHRSFNKPGYNYEMHFKVNGIPDLPIGNEIEDYFLGAIDRAIDSKVGSCNFTALCDVDHSIVSLLHSQIHLITGGFGLRHLCDWASFINKTADCDVWNDINRITEKWGLKVYCDVLCKICMMYLGCKQPYNNIDVPDELCCSIMCDVIYGGNFGIYDNNRRVSRAFIGEKMYNNKYQNKPIEMIRIFHSRTPLYFPFVKKYKILHLIMDLYRILEYIYKIIIGKRPKMSSFFSNANQANDLISQLHLFEIKSNFD